MKGIKTMTKEKFNALIFCMEQRAIQERKYGEFLKVCAELENRIKAKSKNKIKNNNTEE